LNVLRALETAEQVAARLHASRPASEAVMAVEARR